MASLLSQCTYSEKLASNASFTDLFTQLVKVLLHSLGCHLTSKSVPLADLLTWCTTAKLACFLVPNVGLTKYVEYMSAGLEVCKTMSKPYVGGSDEAIMEWEMNKAVEVSRALMQANGKLPQSQDGQPVYVEQIDEVLENGRKEASELKKKLLERSQAALDSARSLLEAIAGGQPAGASWLATFTGTDWPSLQKHADDTLLKMDAELLTTTLLATLKA
eukprot:2037603-Amphidinium_carterae.2